MAAGSSSARGTDAETRACRFLQRQGLSLVARNYRCRLGELDLVLEQDDVLVVAEVRSRRSAQFASPQETVDERKRSKLIRAARHLLMTRPKLGRLPVRFDVVAVTGTGSDCRIEWIKNAFDAE